VNKTIALIIASEIFQNLPDTNAFVFEVDAYLAQSNMPPPHKQSFFNVAMALAMGSWGTMAGSDSNLLIMEKCSNSFLKERGMRLKERKLFLLMRGSLSMMGEVASAKAESVSVHKLLKKVSPSTEAMLEDRNLQSLDFCGSHCDIFFSRGKSASDCLKLMATALSYDIRKFRIEVLVSALILSQEKLQRIPLDI